MKEGSNEGLAKIFDCCERQLPRGVQSGMELERMLWETLDRANVDCLKEVTSTDRGGRGGRKIYVQQEILR
jgi:hypothetical protein